MITPAQIRAARGLLKWTQAALAAKAGISAVTLNMIEAGVSDPKASTLASVESVLKGAGVVFIDENGGGPGVRFREKR